MRTHREVITDAKPHAEGAGYALWDAGDGERMLDLSRLFVGALGTLGIVTEVQITLAHTKPHAVMVVIPISTISGQDEVVEQVLRSKPDSLEMLSGAACRAGIQHHMFAFGMPSVSELQMLARRTMRMVLMAEFRSGTMQEASQKAEGLTEEMRQTRGLRAHVVREGEAIRRYHACAEQNDVQTEPPYACTAFGREMHGLFLEVKKIFDPFNIFHPI